MTEPTVTYAEHELLMLDYQAADKERRRLARKVIVLESEQAVTEDSPEAANVRALLELWWRDVKDSSPRVAHGLESTRAPKVRAALRRRKKIDGGDNEAFDVCRKAVLGVLHDDWAMGRINKTQGKSFNDIAEHILNTDGDIEKFAALYDKHHPSQEEQDELTQRREQAQLERVRALQQEQAEKDSRGREKQTDRLRVFGDNRDPITRILHALPGAEPYGDDRWVTKCPAHGGDNPRSLQITRGDTGCVLLKCWTQGCEIDEITRALGLDVRDLWDRSEFDDNGREYRRPEPRVVPPHLRQAMKQLLERDERQAA